MERPKYEKEWKPTWAGLVIESGYDLLCFAGRVIVIFFLGVLAVNVLARTLVEVFLQYAPSVCHMITITPV